MKDKMRGKAEVAKGKLTDNPAEVAKGRARQAVGSVKQAAGAVKRDIKSAAYDAEHSRKGR